MNKRLIISCLACFAVTSLFGQVDNDWSKRVRESQEKAREEYEQFKQQAQQNYEEFRRQANEEYARFMEDPWTVFESQPAEEIPQLPKPPQPVVVDPTERPVAQPIPFDGKPMTPKPLEQPQPLEPIKPTIQPEAPKTVVRFYGTDVIFRFALPKALRLKDLTEKSVSAFWKQLSQPTFDNLIAQCLLRRSQMNLCDWGYVMLTEQVAETLCGGHNNEAVVLHQYLLTQSGYQMRLAKAGEHLCVLVGSNEKIYHYRYFKIEGAMYYNFDKSLEGQQFQIFNHAFPQEKMMSLVMSQPKLAVEKTVPRTLEAQRYGKVTATVVLNKNLIDFFNSCPLNSEWALYSKASLSEQAKDSLYPVLQQAIEGKTQLEAANILLNFVQTSLSYAIDQKQFGYERPLYPDESLYYPYCDCEDRSILFACLVRELMGLEVVLLDYPEHIATAVQFSDPVEGDYLTLEGKRYVVCDPTYIGATVGLTMPKMKPYSPKVIVL